MHSCSPSPLRFGNATSCIILNTEIGVRNLNTNVDQELKNIYSDIILEYQSGFNPPQRVPKQAVPDEAGGKLSYGKIKMGMVNTPVTTNVYGEQEEEAEGILKIIQDVESEYRWDSPINNAVRLAFGKLKEKLA